MRVICLDLGHWGKRSRPRDRGAVHCGKVEAYEALPIMFECAKALEGQGFLTFLLTYGDYYERNRFANEIDADLYLAFHINSAKKPGDYGLILFDARGDFSGLIAEYLKAEFEKALPWRFRIKSIYERDRGFAQIRFTKMPALLLEPFFLNSEFQVRNFSREDFALALVSGVKKASKELRI